jgi:hypothetical protein
MQGDLSKCVRWGPRASQVKDATPPRIADMHHRTSYQESDTWRGCESVVQPKFEGAKTCQHRLPRSAACDCSDLAPLSAPYSFWVSPQFRGQRLVPHTISLPYLPFGRPRSCIYLPRATSIVTSRSTKGRLESNRKSRFVTFTTGGGASGAPCCSIVPL